MYSRRLVHYFMYVAWCSVYTTTARDWHFTGENIAYGKPAEQGPDTYFDTFKDGTIKKYTADLAVDGNNSSRLLDGSCTHTEGSSSDNAYWQVDLQKAYTITGIVIYNRAGYKDRLKNFIIYGNGTKVIHNSSGSDEYMDSEIYIPLDGTRFFSSTKIQLPANDGHSDRGQYYLTLCEVEIYAAATCDFLDIMNGGMQPNQNSFEVNSQALIVCNKGFKPAVQNITCSNNKEWTYYTPCSRVYCAYPGKPLNGEYLKKDLATYLPSPLPYDSVITVRCDLGYRSKNTENRTCQQNGAWSGGAPLCTREQFFYPEDVLCHVPNVTNGQFLNLMTSKFKIGTSLYFTCNPGFTPATSQNGVTCLENLRWSETPECKAQETVKQTSLTAAVIGGISGAVVIVVIMISGLVVYLDQRRKRNLKHQEELITYTNLRKPQDGHSNDNYAGINATEIENGGSSKDEKPTLSEYPIYCNTGTEV